MGSFILGDSTQGPSSGGFSGITAVKATLSQSGALQSLSIWFANNSGTGINCLLGIYDATASGGFAGNLIATTAVFASTQSLATIPTTTNPVLQPGDYWIAIQNQNVIEACYLNPGATGEWYNQQGWTGSLPDPFPSGYSNGPYQFSLYATLNTVAAVTGTLSTTESGDASAISGAVAWPVVTGALAGTEANDTWSGSGSVAWPVVSGGLAATEPNDVANITALARWLATLSSVEAHDFANVSAIAYTSATLSATEAHDIMSAGSRGEAKALVLLVGL